MASQDWFDKDFYAVLGVPQDADADAIKKAYRKAARKYHPDKNPGDKAAEEKFKDVSEAHQVLSDPEERQQYDAIRQMARGGARFSAGGPGGPGGGGGFEDVFSSMFGGGGGSRVRFTTSGGGARPGGSPNFEDILSGLFQQNGGYGAPGYGSQGRAGQGYDGQGYGYGGDPFGGYGAPQGPRKGQDIEARTTISFHDSVVGTTATLQSPTGERVTTRIPAGVKDGQKIRLRGKGYAGDPGAEAGDLYLVVTVTPDTVFGRDGDNLTVDLPVSFAEAALGATVPVPTVDGGQVKVKIAPGTPSGRVLRVKGRGVQRKGAPGDLLAKVQVVVPQHLSDAERSAVEVLAAQEAGQDPRAELLARAAAAHRG